ncbi:MAG: nitrogen fixation protein NifX [Nitrospirae bacterium GWC2_57_13]|jgi:nitrogen fixation protein NifX|nr:MAG: nitrogen fixation protein NifX [Nitrospirae bacterium GWC2_57_13]OGW44138.1 MAG: nitrogen fixation protein NifX [Nitrospirae bacterium GWD2_57_8]HAS55578.1 nitrogen fixation protein NifX [Nitrospiraceae bacterium]
MKIAFATTDEKNINDHFGRAGMFAVYDISKDGSRFVEIRKFADGEDTSITSTREQGQVHEDLVQAKVDRLSDCRIVYLTEIGGPAAARLVKKGMMPLKVKEVTAIDDALAQLKATISGSPPPWLRKAMNTE